MRDLRRLPKAHLHLHLEGAMRPSTLKELADEHGIPLPVFGPFASFAQFIELYAVAIRVMRREEDVHRLVMEVAEDAGADGAVWVENHVYPPLHRDRFGSDEAVLELILEAGAAASVATGVGVGVVLAADRTMGPDDAARQARLAARYADEGVVAFGLANDEALFPPEPFAEAFAIAKEAGLLSVPHAGELAGPESVRGALDHLRPDRIEHGVRAAEEPGLFERIAAEDVCLDVCPSSNLALGLYSSMETHPLRQILDTGVTVSLSADDPLLFGPGLGEEYELVQRALGLDDTAMAAIAAASVERSGAPAATKSAAAQAIKAWTSS